MTKELFSKLYEKELQYFKDDTFENSLKLLLNDLINHTETDWDLFGIRYDTVMSKKEWEDFINHPERNPYKTKIESLRNKSIEEFFIFALKFLKDIFAYYKSLEDSEYKTELKKLINSFLETVFNARFQIDEQTDGDTYVGRSKEDRDNGNIELMPITKNKYEYAIIEYSRYANKDPKKVKENIMQLCQNDLRRLNEAMSICNIDYETRLEIRGISDVLSRDLVLTFGDVKRGWQVWKYFREIGIDTEEYLNLLGLPDYETIKRRLTNFSKNKNYVDEMLSHLKDDLPESYEKYIKQGYIDTLDLRYENAKRKQYPTQLRKEEETRKMISDVEAEVFELFPLAKHATPRNIILTPTHPASTARAFNSTIKNSEGLPINTIVMTPRVDNIDDYLPTFAHEVTHALHRKVLDAGEKSGVLKKGAADAVSSAVMEVFSMLVDDQFEAGHKLPYQKSFTGKTFPNFWAGYVTRFQVPFALTQLSIRKEFDEMYNNLKDEEKQSSQLSEDQIYELKYKFDKLTREWLSLGINIKNNISAFNLFDSYNPRDGVVYMRTYMMQENLAEDETTKDTILEESANKEDKPGEKMPMHEAFKKRFGEKWVKEKDARIMLHWLLLETGRNEHTEDYYEFVLNKPIEEAVAELEKINLKVSDIV